MPQPIFIVDAFADAPFSGNPAAVVPLDEPVEAEWMQAVAAEMNLSETAFVERATDASGAQRLRWFTPTAEVALCGHATLAAAHVLGGSRRFSTMSGELTCVADAGGWVEMDFPIDPVREVSASVVEGAFPGIEASFVGEAVSDLLVVADSEAAVRGAKPDLAVIASLPVRGVILTATASGSDVDFVSRCFYPRVGVPEDPVTGSAHCTLAAYWSERNGQQRLVGRQISTRGGVVRLDVRDERVGLAGRAVTVMAGELVA